MSTKASVAYAGQAWRNSRDIRLGSLVLIPSGPEQSKAGVGARASPWRLRLPHERIDRAGALAPHERIDRAGALRFAAQAWDRGREARMRCERAIAAIGD